MKLATRMMIVTGLLATTFVFSRWRSRKASMSKDKVEGVGFPDFWQTAYDVKPDAFKAIGNLEPIQEELLKKTISEPLHKVLRHIAKMTFNSLGALVTILMNGYGNDGMKVARSMFEAAITVAYLRKHSDQLDDYLDFYHILTKRQLDYLDAKEPDRVKGLSAKRRAEIEAEYKRVLPRFIKNGYPRSSWCKESIYKMAKEVGREDLYKTYYASASGMHHVDISALTSQTEELSLDVDVAPSVKWIDTALVIGHGSVLTILNDYNEEASLGMDKELERAADYFKQAWKK